MKAQEAPTFKGWLKKRRNAQKKEKTKRREECFEKREWLIDRCY